MAPAGGLKLAVHGGGRDDRRVHFAEVAVRRDDGDERHLVTDADGRLRYRLPSGEYEIQVATGGGAHCTIRPDGWTSVHLQLP